MNAEPHIIGVRHHSPACARLVADRIRALKPAFVLIEGPADFNHRLDELALPHRLPVAIYSYVSGRLEHHDGVDEPEYPVSQTEVHHGSWTPFAEHSPEWQALSVGRAVGAALRFIDLPAWHASFSNKANRYADEDGERQEQRADGYLRGLATRLCIESSDALWDQLFEDETDLVTLAENLRTHFFHLRNQDPGSIGNQAREAKMADWIAWAMAQDLGPVLVVCGGYHAPALASLWYARVSQFAKNGEEPVTPSPQIYAPTTCVAPDDAASGLNGLRSLLNHEPSLRYGSFLVPYTFKRLDAFAGYASGMPSPAYYQSVWNYGNDGAGRQMLKEVLTRLRGKKLPASTADLMAMQVRAHGLARLRGHRQPLRSDWLDALAGALLKDALDAPLPWSYRGPLRPGTDPILVQTMDVLAGDQAGKLAAATPQPPLVAALWLELEAAGLVISSQPINVTLDLLTPMGRLRSQLLHRASLLELPGFIRRSGPKLALSGECKELWILNRPPEQIAALIEAGAWGATLLDAARAKLEDTLRRANCRIINLADGLNRAAFAGLSGLSQAVMADLQIAVAQEPQFESLAPALGMLLTLLRHGQALGMAGAPVLQVMIEAGVDRALWLLEPPAAVPLASMTAHLQGFSALRQIAADVLSMQHPRYSLADGQEQTGNSQALALEIPRMFAVFQRKASCGNSAAVSRGAALGAMISLHAHLAPETSDHTTIRDEALTVMTSLPAEKLGDAVCGLLALAREQLMHDPQFVAGIDACIQGLDDHDFLIALPALRGAFAWLPTRERGNLAEHVLGLYQGQHLSRRYLTDHASTWTQQAIAEHQLAEKQAIARLAEWGIVWK